MRYSNFAFLIGFLKFFEYDVCMKVFLKRVIVKIKIKPSTAKNKSVYFFVFWESLQQCTIQHTQKYMNDPRFPHRLSPNISHTLKHITRSICCHVHLINHPRRGPTSKFIGFDCSRDKLVGVGGAIVPQRAAPFSTSTKWVTVSPSLGSTPQRRQHQKTSLIASRFNILSTLSPIMFPMPFLCPLIGPNNQSNPSCGCLHLRLSPFSVTCNLLRSTTNLREKQNQA